jgi:predicted RNA-binding protein with PIN domain
MAFQIIVDGYNFIGKHRGLRGDIEGHREELIRKLARYRAVKGHSVTVVFDGGRSGWPDEHGEVREGIHVVFSRHGESADEVITRMAEELGNACVVVSSDREVARAVQRAGGVAIRIGEFESRLRAAFSPMAQAGLPEEEEPFSGGTQKGGNPRRLSKEDRMKQNRLHKL